MKVTKDTQDEIQRLTRQIVGVLREVARAHPEYGLNSRAFTSIAKRLANQVSGSIIEEHKRAIIKNIPLELASRQKISEKDSWEDMPPVAETVSPIVPVGDRAGRLVLLGELKANPKWWVFRCDCGRYVVRTKSQHRRLVGPYGPMCSKCEEVEHQEAIRQWRQAGSKGEVRGARCWRGETCYMTPLKAGISYKCGDCPFWHLEDDDL